ncbi:glycolipid transfer protein 3 isoform X1 [Coffea arabica]|uniref:Glycolipid transfer protein 3 isoform X1 n=1 Tax=Coffea arabica TaxID=13443 RepID=A0A6P6UQQ3_COFAR|nr:glycolipid transfer protein 3-like isoform X1 [Coffea arabica]
MKRRRELEMGSEIRSAIDELSMVVLKVKPAGGPEQHSTCAYIPTKPFLSVCNLLLQVLGLSLLYFSSDHGPFINWNFNYKIGPTMAVLRQDVHQNIQRLEKFYESEPSVYSNVVEILSKEGKEGKAKKGPSCSKAFVWLTRSLDFTVTLLQLLVEDFGRDMEQAVDEAYNITLKPWHGWISSAAYKVALKLVPDIKDFITILMAEDENQDMLKEEMRTLISLFLPVLEGIRTILKTFGLDRLKCT